MPERHSNKAHIYRQPAALRRAAVQHRSGNRRTEWPAGPSFNCAISSFNQSRHPMRNESVQVLCVVFCGKQWNSLKRHTNSEGAIVCDCMRDGVHALFAKHTHIVCVCGCSGAVDTLAHEFARVAQRRDMFVFN